MDRSKDLEYSAEKLPFPLPLIMALLFALFFSPHFPLVANIALGSSRIVVMNNREHVGLTHISH